MNRLFALALLCCAVGACALPPKNRTALPPLQAVERVELERYLGEWREAARLPNSFEKGCVAATAQYSLRPDGLLGIVNTCRKADGATNAVDGKAKIVQDAGNAKLKVSFFGPFFFGDYWVIALAPDYSWSIVGEPRGRFLWLLTRAPETSPELRQTLTERVVVLGYDPSKLIWN
jgi:apolipoprotein D and lipocalin family protein